MKLPGVPVRCSPEVAASTLGEFRGEGVLEADDDADVLCRCRLSVTHESQRPLMALERPRHPRS
jgi:hypothetical protein